MWTVMPVINNIRILGLLYADDLLFVAISVQGLQKTLIVVEKYFKNANSELIFETQRV
jgi:hypothetical protein